jgi:TP901 family phage tail tape measure protein
MGKEYVVSILFNLLDKTTGPLRNLKAKVDALDPSLNRVTRTTENLGRTRTGINGLNNALSKTGKTAGKVQTAFSGLRGSLTAFGGVASVMAAAPFVMLGKNILAFEERVARVSIMANQGLRSLVPLKKQIKEISVLTAQSPDDLLSGVEEIIERSGNFKLAVDTLERLGMVATATGSNMRDIGAAANEINEKFGITEDKIWNMFDILSAQGKKGAFTLQKMASLFPRLLSVASSFGATGETGLRKFGAILQIGMRGTGSPERTTTGLENLLQELMDPKLIKKLKGKFGVDVFDREKSAKEGRRVLKDIDVIMEDIIKKTKGDNIIIGGLFQDRAIRIVRPLVESLRKGREELNRFIGMGGDGSAIMQDFNYIMSLTNVKLRVMGNRIKKIMGERFESTFFDPLMWFMDKMEQYSGATKLIADITLISGLMMPIVAAATFIISSPIAATIFNISLIVGGLAVGIKAVNDNWRTLKHEFGSRQVGATVDMLSVLTGGIIPKTEDFTGAKNEIIAFVNNKLGLNSVPPKKRKDLKFNMSWRSMFDEMLNPNQAGQFNQFAFAQSMGSASFKNKSWADIKIRVEAEPGTTATLGPARQSPNSNVSVFSNGVLGGGGF